jgi:2-polyprenyl-3-methyl-5-hydroxy-6-metoxy-1,4-benzoquinol methylase
MKIVSSRVDPLVKFAKGKKVLDIGCVGMGEEDTYGGKNWIHGKMAKNAKKVVGIDIQKKEIEKLREKGFDIRLQNAEEPFNLNEKFDIVMAEEVIEHLADLKTFFANVHRHLGDGGLLIITTPNPQAFEFFLQKLLFGRTLINPYHTHWQNEVTLKYLLERNGFELINYFFVEEWAENLRGRAFQVLFFWLPQCFARTGAYIAKKK